MRKYLIWTPRAILPETEGGKCLYAPYFSHVVLRIRECEVFSTISSPQYYLIVPSHPGHHSKCSKMRQLVLNFDLFVFVKYSGYSARHGWQWFFNVPPEIWGGYWRAERDRRYDLWVIVRHSASSLSHESVWIWRNILWKWMSFFCVFFS